MFPVLRMPTPGGAHTSPFLSHSRYRSRGLLRPLAAIKLSILLASRSTIADSSTEPAAGATFDATCARSAAAFASSSADERSWAAGALAGALAARPFARLRADLLRGVAERSVPPEALLRGVTERSVPPEARLAADLGVPAPPVVLRGGASRAKSVGRTDAGM